jgi:hypothetical protein
MTASTRSPLGNVFTPELDGTPHNTATVVRILVAVVSGFGKCSSAVPMQA